MSDPDLNLEIEALRRELEEARDIIPRLGGHVASKTSACPGCKFLSRLSPLSYERLAEIQAEREAEKAEVWEEGWRAGCRSQEPEIGFQPNPYRSRAAAKGKFPHAPKAA